ncbi:MAG TPA: glycoside hydrolase family 2 TIM barrel-domain containing protein [Roseiflexaceae bacterium]|nr:glycoside hydrolase family 2 TIM barrel-domain containing protein [Roseiflexaceae bacterium]
MDLSGTWSFRLDPQDVGIAERWFERSLDGTIQLPGSLQAQGYGDEVRVDTPWTGGIIDRSWFTEPRYAPYREPGNVKVPFWLQPEKYYAGAAWYQREFEAPAWWPGHRVTLTLERPHWGTRVWLDGRECAARHATNMSLSTPHVYDLGEVAPGPHRLTVRVDNRMLVEVGVNAHSVSDHTQTNWNGIVGRIELAAGSPVWLEEVQVFPRVADRTAVVRVRLGNAHGRPGGARLMLQARLANAPGQHEPPPLSADVALSAEGGEAELTYQLGDEARLWDEFSPALYALDVRVDATVDGRESSDTRTVTFGLREVSVQGTQLAVNGRPIFLRGTLECCIFPLTGYPPTDVDAWKRIIRTCQAHGLNHIRFHSWCPPEAAFVAADELGFYYQVECASWANQGATIGDGRPLDSWLYEEGERIVSAYGNHPSFLMMAYGNEPGGEHHPEYLAKWVTYWKQRDPRRVHTSGAGWPAIPENDYHNIPQPRIQRWGEELRSRINALPPETITDYSDYVKQHGKPIVSHEIGQWCVYPNFDEIGKYTGVLKAKNFEIFRDFLAANHMSDRARAFLIASGKLQTLCYKEEIESALRTPGFAGFQLLDLHDFPGQGTALVGVLDPFWDSKGYVTPSEFHRFCGATVPLARLEKRYWRASETLRAAVDVAHYGPRDLTAAAAWRLEDARGTAVARGRLPAANIPTGALTRLGTIEAPLGELASAAKYRLVVRLDEAGAENDWDIWVFADRLDTEAPAEVLVTGALDEAALARLTAGGAVLLTLPPARVNATAEIGFSSVFWNTAWTRGQAPHTLGILTDPAHPALAAFPTEEHSNWQWWELIHGAAAMTLDHLPPSLRPIVQPIDTWFEARRLGLLFEARAGGGRLMVCSMDLSGDLERRLVARQLRHSLLRYMASDAFHPRQEVALEDIRALEVRGSSAPAK